MLPHLPTLSADDFHNVGNSAAVVLAILVAGAGGWLGADRLHLIGGFRATAAGVGAASVYLTFVPSMMLFGSLGGLFYVPVALLLSAIHAPEQVVVGQVIVAISTAMGCGLIAWLACTGIFVLPAVAAAARRRMRS